MPISSLLQTRNGITAVSLDLQSWDAIAFVCKAFFKASLVMRYEYVIEIIDHWLGGKTYHVLGTFTDSIS